MQSERIAEEIVLDFETRSAVDLKKVGPWVYSEHYSTEIICLCWEVNDVPFEWRPGDPIPWRTLIYHLHEGTLFVAHNAMFERAIWKNILVDLYDWPPVPHEQWDCTQAACAMKALPLRLEFANKALDLPEQKDMEGAAALKKATKPRKPTKADPHSVWHEGPEITGRIVNYCHQDVKAQKNLRRRIGPLPSGERAVYLLDQKMNERGIKMDVEAIRAGIKVVDEIAGGVDAEFREITGLNIGQRDRVLVWLKSKGCPIPNTQGETIDEFLAERDRFHPQIGRVLELKRRASRASNHKLPAMLRQTCSDGRSRGTMQYHGATTGRNTGRLWQPLNLPRPSGPFEDFGEREICAFMEVLKLQDTSFLEAIYGDALEAISNMLRGFLTVGRGCKMVAGDWAGIEARILAALGGETWKIEAFRAADRGEGRDIYCIAADKVFGYRVEGKKTHPRERQVGKTCELAFGYQGGVGAWRNFDSSDRYTDEEVDAFKQAWRDGHPGICDKENGLWYKYERAAVATAYRKQPHSVGPIEFALEDDWLTIRLPSGRKLWYFKPEVRIALTPWDTEQLKLSYMQQRDGQWKRVDTYGGKITENIVQAISRDILVPATFKAERYRHPVILTIYDEIVTEPLERDADPELLRQIMCDVDPWVKELDIPIAADPWIGTRYRK